MFKLVENEVLKLLSKKKLVLVTAILMILIPLYVYGYNNSYKSTIKSYMKNSGQSVSYDWKALVKQQIDDLETTINSPFLIGNKNAIKVEIEQYKYYLEHNINPITPSTAKFTIAFMQEAINLFLPLLVIIMAVDIVSGEISSKTIKILLTRAVPRWKIVLSKYIAILILIPIVILEAGVICIVASSLIFHNLGWSEPIATGFKVAGDKLDASSVIRVFQWQYLILVYSLAWFASVCVATLAFTISVLVRNTAAAIGIMMALLIGPQILQYFLSDWPLVKYLFSVNLNLTQYLSGSYQPIAGMSLYFSIFVLSVWSIIALVISFGVFIKQDVLV